MLNNDYFIVVCTWVTLKKYLNYLSLKKLKKVVFSLLAEGGVIVSVP